MIFQLIAAAAAAGMVMTSTSCAQRERHEDPKGDVFVISTGSKKAWLGVSVENMTERVSRRMNVKTEQGALVNSVSEDSPAEKAGIKDDDIIISFNGKPVEDASDLTRAVGKTEPGKTVECVVMRRDEKKSFQVTVAKPPERWAHTPPHAPMAPVGPVHVRHQRGGMLGLGVMDLNRQLAEFFEIPGGRGVLVKEVEKDRAGAKAGLKAGDVIVSIGKNDVDDIDDIHWALNDFEEGDTVTVGYVRKGSRKSATVKLDESSGPRAYWFKSEMSPNLDFNFDIDLEGLDEIGPEMDRLREELEQGKEEREALGREVKRESERAIKETKRETERAAREAQREAMRAVKEVKAAMQARTI